MQVQNENGKLILSYSPKTRATLLGCTALIPLAYLVYKLVQGKLESGDAIGIGVGMLVFAIAGIGLWTPSRFVFDKSTELVTWQKKKVGSSKEGHASFADIKEVKRIEQRDAESTGWRVVLVLSNQEVPLIDGYIQNEKQAKQIASEINQFLGRG